MTTEASENSTQTDGNMPSVGAYLRKIRKNHQLSIDDLAAITKIRSEHISAIEDDENPKGIPNPYYRGYIRCYCRFFGLDSETILKQIERDEYHVPKSAHDEINAFKVRQIQGSMPRSNSRNGNKAKDSKKLLSPLKMILGLCLVVIGFLVYQHLPYLGSHPYHSGNGSNDDQYDSIIHIS